MKRTTIIIIAISAIIILVLTGLLLYYSFQDSNGSSLPSVQNGEKEIIEGNQEVAIDTDIGEVVVEDAVLSMEGEYEVLRSNESYKILHNIPDNSFQIIIYKQPFFEIREFASKAFIEALHISEQDACELNITVSTPASIDPDYAGQTYGLSFCE